MLQIYDTITVKDGWVICPACSKKRLFPIRPETSVRNLPCKCKKCTQEFLVNIEAPVPASKETSA